jgi:hypothetical protein
MTTARATVPEASIYENHNPLSMKQKVRIKGDAARVHSPARDARAGKYCFDTTLSGLVAGASDGTHVV